MTDRNRHIRLIHVLIRERGMTEDEYRALYESSTRKTSLKAMTEKDLQRVVSALKSYGAKKRQYKPASLFDSPQARKIRSLWLTLKDMGELRNSSEQALLAYIKRLTGVDRMEWLKSNQMSYVIETLKKWVARVEKKQIEVQVEQAVSL